MSGLTREQSSAVWVKRAAEVQGMLDRVNALARLPELSMDTEAFGGIRGGLIAIHRACANRAGHALVAEQAAAPGKMPGEEYGDPVALVPR